MRKKEIVLLDFSGAFKEQEFWKKRDTVQIQTGDIQGTNCYCDEEAADCLRECIGPYGAGGVHFLDSGNYHYMSRLWLEKMEEPFCLILFDNHTDMQPPAFGGLLSCGGWAAAALEELPLLKHILLIGPDQAAWGLVSEEHRDRVDFLSREELSDITDKKAFLESCRLREYADKKMPLYLSVDKDILCAEDAVTTWSQGDMHLSELLEWISDIFAFAEERGISVMGADICGEADEPFTGGEKNDRANESLLFLLEEKRLLHRQEPERQNKGDKKDEK